jgi:hypothetical protein
MEARSRKTGTVSVMMSRPVAELLRQAALNDPGFRDMQKPEIKL